MFIYVEMRKYMKKKLFSVLLVGALAASLVACDSKKKEVDKTPSTVNTEINADEYAATITDNAGIYKTFVSPDFVVPVVWASVVAVASRRLCI